MKNHNEDIIQVDSGYFCADVSLVNYKIIDAAPILRWAIGKHIDWFEQYAARKRWKLNIVPPFTGTILTQLNQPKRKSKL